MNLTPFKRRAAVFALGMLSVLALPPVNWVIFLIPTFSGWLWLLFQEKRGWAAWTTAWLFGLGHFIAGLHWLVHPFLVDPERHAWIAPFALLALAGWMAVFPALAGWVAWRVPFRGAARVLVFSVFWAIGEWLRGWLLTGFPWNPMATAWNGSDAMLQSASVIGALGLGLLTVLAAAMPVTMMTAMKADRGHWRATGLAALGLALVWMGGVWRLQPWSSPAEIVTAGVRVVQPNINQRDKWKPEKRQANFARLLTLSETKDSPAPSIIIWPEAAPPFLLDEDPGALAEIAALLPEGGVLLTGAVRRAVKADGSVQLWNSILVVSHKGEVIGRYDKTHLVPFGEYVPLRDFLPLDKMVAGAVDYSPGPPDQRLDLPKPLPSVLPLICYEALFADEIPARNGARWLLNVTNDAWFGPGAGPRQHLAAARLRAVEQGLPMARAANTGISAIIDGHGRVLRTLPLGEPGYLDASLPPTLPPTPFSRLGAMAPAGMVLVCMALAIFLHRRRAVRGDGGLEPSA